MNADPFSLLHVPPRPRIDESTLQRTLDELSLRHHPDRGGNSDDLARINAASKILLSPHQRLEALARRAGWEDDGNRTRSAPAPLSDLIFAVAHACHTAQSLVSKPATTPIASAVRTRDLKRVSNTLAGLLIQLESALASANSALESLDAQWDALPDDERIQRALPLRDTFAFLTRAQENLAEAATALQIVLS